MGTINNKESNLPKIGAKSPYFERSSNKTSQPGPNYMNKLTETKQSGAFRPNTTNPSGAFQHPKIGTKHPDVFKNVNKNLNAS